VTTKLDQEQCLAKLHFYGNLKNIRSFLIHQATRGLRSRCCRGRLLSAACFFFICRHSCSRLHLDYCSAWL